MANQLSLTDEAILEIDDAIEYYKTISPALAYDLQIKILETLTLITNDPDLLPAIRGNYRKANLARFPYKIVYRTKGNLVVVVAFQHHKRKPFYWKGR